MKEKELTGLKDFINQLPKPVQRYISLQLYYTIPDILPDILPDTFPKARLGTTLILAIPKWHDNRISELKEKKPTLLNMLLSLLNKGYNGQYHYAILLGIIMSCAPSLQISIVQNNEKVIYSSLQNLPDNSTKFLLLGYYFHIKQKTEYKKPTSTSTIVDEEKKYAKTLYNDVIILNSSPAKFAALNNLSVLLKENFTKNNALQSCHYLQQASDGGLPIAWIKYAYLNKTEIGDVTNKMLDAYYDTIIGPISQPSSITRPSQTQNALPFNFN